jgi:2-polyprenyl-6-methoxyphenol hydroxylase-like FAD-dependent oxidoreductase
MNEQAASASGSGNAATTTCCVVGGGPAGLMLGLLLARAGVEVTVLEKHGDFLRDFRGDTVHPTSIELLDDLGLGERFARLPQRRLEEIQVPTASGLQPIASLRVLPGRYKYVALVPQWEFLDLLAAAGSAEPAFTLRMHTEATGLLTRNGRVVGVRYRTEDGVQGRIHAALTVACDGRGSILRAAAGLAARQWPTPMDALWFKLPRKPSDPAAMVPVLTMRQATVMLDRGDYWQCGALIPKGSDPQQRRRPVAEFLAPLIQALPWLADRADALRSWDQVKLLEVRLDRLRRWHTDGLLCIGDAAHAMSPAGGVGINLAIQDAVAAARLLAEPLRRGVVTPAQLARVRRRRLPATVAIQGLQRLLHELALRPALEGKVDLAAPSGPPLPLRLLQRWALLQRIPTYLVARGVRPERAPQFARRAPQPVGG